MNDRRGADTRACRADTRVGAGFRPPLCASSRPLPWLRLILALAACAALPGQKLERTFPGAQRVEVDNVWGSIRVTGYEGRDAQLSAVRTIKADTDEQRRRAEEEVRLDMTEREGTVRLYVDGPFRCQCRHGEEGWRDRDDLRYQVRYDFELRVPAGAALRLRTVNEGEIVVENTSGDYDLQNINGRIEMREVAGSGRVRSVNRPVRVVFRRNPAAASEFTSVNGEVELQFQPGLAADFRVKTLNGRVYCDFAVNPLAPRPAAAERREGRFVYRADRYTGVRVGAGGPEIKLETINGTIRISERGKEQR